MNRHHTTISRELKRNSGKRGYRPKQAQEKAKKRHADKLKKSKLSDELIDYIKEKLQARWSPEQICGRLKIASGRSLAHETIYRFILKDKKEDGELYRYLRHQAKPYKKRYGKKDYRGKIPHRTDISERPEVVNSKKRLGDWEVDLVIGKGHKGVIVTLAERVSRLYLALPVANKQKEVVADGITELLGNLKKWVYTLTYDNGREFSDHQKVNDDLECQSYFAKPYHSWERGLNENSNGLLRQYFPKKMPLNNLTKEAVFKAVAEMNGRPRKCLGYKTPLEVFIEQAKQKENQILSGALMS